MGFSGRATDDRPRWKRSQAPRGQARCVPETWRRARQLIRPKNPARSQLSQSADALGVAAIFPPVERREEPRDLVSLRSQANRTGGIGACHPGRTSSWQLHPLLPSVSFTRSPLSCLRCPQPRPFYCLLFPVGTARTRGIETRFVHIGALLRSSRAGISSTHENTSGRALHCVSHLTSSVCNDSLLFVL